jgi:hypothetical protein
LFADLSVQAYKVGAATGKDDQKLRGGEHQQVPEEDGRRCAGHAAVPLVCLCSLLISHRNVLLPFREHFIFSCGFEGEVSLQILETALC